jgi:hypothetical protein
MQISEMVGGAAQGRKTETEGGREMNPIKLIREKHASMKLKFEKSASVFEPSVNPDDLSVGEMIDLLALEIGESTFTDQDVKRIA